MSGALIALIVVLVALAVLVIAALAWWDRRRSRALQARFGSEYERALDGADRKREARRELRERMERRQELEMHDLTPASAERFQREWIVVQEQFVDQPATAVTMAHRLLTQVMAERGYPTDDHDERVDMLSVDHADVIDRYRRAAAVESRGQAGRASTEDLRQAMQHYRALFDQLLGDALSPRVDRDTGPYQVIDVNEREQARRRL